ncbi:transporter, major facilitator family protein [Teladorsagia circumcincta]|uniref:Transporter, major facilitator family protein n=1 Tax=Teladorsagia circumcincta TaxID=45464 RepID=A0A2G9UB21_TELCI|nr:transporter, major facilitator family protein [Teladorsagia circumcincta]
MYNEELDSKDADLTFQTVVALFGVGGAVGGLSSGVLADAAGRRGCLLYTNIIAFLAAAFMGTAKYAGIYLMLHLGRFFIGFYIMGHPMLFGTPDWWPLIFGFIAIPAIVQVITLPMIPESPRFTLCIRGEVEQAREDLEILRGTRDVGAEIDSMKAEAAALWETLYDRPSMFDMFRREFRRPTFIVIVMMIFQQLTGINAVMFYSTMIFEKVGLSDREAILATILVGTVNLTTTFLQMYLIDKPEWGRIPLLKMGTIGMIASTFLLMVAITYKEYTTAQFGAVFLVLIFVFSFALGPAAISWLLASELFLTNARANGNAYMAAANWTTSSLIGLVFPEINGSKEGSKASTASVESKASKKAAVEGKLTGALAFAVFSVTLGSFQFGYHIGCVNAPGHLITEWIVESHQHLFNTTIDKPTADFIWSVVVSAFPVGGAVGGLISGALADKAGRRGGLLYTNLVAFIAAVLMGGAKPANMYPMMIAGRFFIGIYADQGMNKTLLRIFGLPQLLGTRDRWPYIFWFTVVPALLQVITLQMVPESPKFTLVVRGNVEKATTDLEKLRGTKDVSSIFLQFLMVTHP